MNIDDMTHEAAGFSERENMEWCEQVVRQIAESTGIAAEECERRLRNWIHGVDEYLMWMAYDDERDREIAAGNTLWHPLWAPSSGRDDTLKLALRQMLEAVSQRRP